MLGVSWGMLSRQTCKCECECTCKARAHPTTLQDSLDSLGVEWGLHVRPNRERTKAVPPPPPQPPTNTKEPLQQEQRDLPQEAPSEEDITQVFKDVHIDDAVARRLCFAERLEVWEVKATGGEGGGAVGHVRVALAASRTPHHLHVRVAGSATVAAPGGARCATSVNGCVDHSSLRTADERRFERCEDPTQEVQERRLYLAQDENNPSGHYVNIVARQRVGDFEDRRAQDVPFSTVANLASESLIVLLLRYVGVVSFVGRLRLQTVLPNGALTPLLFESSPPKKRKVYGTELCTIAVTQTFADARGCEVVLRSLVAVGTGQLLRHAPVGMEKESATAYVLRLPMGSQPTIDASALGGPQPLARSWRRDLQAQATLRDKKEEQEIRGRGYLLDRPEVRSLLGGYVQAALLERPLDGVSLAQRFFAGEPPRPRAAFELDPDEETDSMGGAFGDGVSIGRAWATNEDSEEIVRQLFPDPFGQETTSEPIYPYLSYEEAPSNQEAYELEPATRDLERTENREEPYDYGEGEAHYPLERDEESETSYTGVSLEENEDLHLEVSPDDGEETYPTQLRADEDTGLQVEAKMKPTYETDEESCPHVSTHLEHSQVIGETPHLQQPLEDESHPQHLHEGTRLEIPQDNDKTPYPQQPLADESYPKDSEVESKDYNTDLQGKSKEIDHNENILVDNEELYYQDNHSDDENSYSQDSEEEEDSYPKDPYAEDNVPYEHSTNEEQEWPLIEEEQESEKEEQEREEEEQEREGERWQALEENEFGDEHYEQDEIEIQELEDNEEGYEENQEGYVEEEDYK